MQGTSKRNLVIIGALACSVIGGLYLYLHGTRILREKEYKYALPPLSYAFDALEPYIDAETMRIHYTKHHQTYVDKLNAAMKDNADVRHKSLEYLLMHLDEVPEGIRAAVRNQGGGHYNHSFFWLCMTPQGTKHPVGKVKELIDKTFKTFEQFKEHFSQAALSVFGSGWVWLVLTKDTTLKIMITHNQDTPIANRVIPLLGLDVWEHAYYLKYQNSRAEYIQAWWHVVNWEQVEKNYLAALNSFEPAVISH